MSAKLYHKIVLAGGSGYLGTVLAHYFADRAEEVIILSRKPAPTVDNIRTLVWNAETEGDWTAALTGADLLVNLCGKNVNCRYTEKNKAEIFASRLVPTGLLNKVIADMQLPPKVWINITSATIYRHAEDRPQDEETGEMGSGFSVDVCRAWEQKFFEANIKGVRKVALRMGIVLGASDSAFPRLLNLTRVGLGGKQGDGRQMVSWIHEDDAAAITEWVLTNQDAPTVINCTAPNPVDNTTLMKTIRQAINMPIGLPCPAWLLAIGAGIIGTETELILKSRWVVPHRLLQAGYRFKYPHIEAAVAAIVKS